MTTTTLHAGYSVLAGPPQGGLASRTLVRLGTALISAGTSLASTEVTNVERFHRHLERRTDLRALAHSGTHLI